MAIDCLAYASSPVKAQTSASVYAASTSNCSALHPMSGLDWDPQQMDGGGFATYVREAHGMPPLESICVLASFSAAVRSAPPSATCARIIASCAPFTSA